MEQQQQPDARTRYTELSIVFIIRSTCSSDCESMHAALSMHLDVRKSHTANTHEHVWLERCSNNSAVLAYALQQHGVPNIHSLTRLQDSSACHRFHRASASKTHSFELFAVSVHDATRQRLGTASLCTIFAQFAILLAVVTRRLLPHSSTASVL